MERVVRRPERSGASTALCAVRHLLLGNRTKKIFWGFGQAVPGVYEDDSGVLTTVQNNRVSKSCIGYTLFIYEIEFMFIVENSLFILLYITVPFCNFCIFCNFYIFCIFCIYIYIYTRTRVGPSGPFTI